jgi:hypothetical protein
MTVIYNMSIDRADKPWIGDRRFTPESAAARAESDCCGPRTRPTIDTILWTAVAATQAVFSTKQKMVFTMWYKVSADEFSDEMSMAEITALIESGDVKDETPCFVDVRDLFACLLGTG